MLREKSAQESVAVKMQENTKRKLVLAVDDEDLTREVLAQALTVLGYQAVAVSNGEEALQLYLSRRPAAIITDIHMPKMNGLELLREVKKLDANLPVILITGYDAGEARKAAESYGAKALLIKPFRIHELKDILVEVLK